MTLCVLLKTSDFRETTFYKVKISLGLRACSANTVLHRQEDGRGTNLREIVVGLVLNRAKGGLVQIIFN